MAFHTVYMLSKAIDVTKLIPLIKCQVKHILARAIRHNLHLTVTVILS